MQPPPPPFKLPRGWEFFTDATEFPAQPANDCGMCLSLHQPWASLVVLGFKRLEGRVWSTDYRGPLWIHAASLLPDPATYELLCQQYDDVYDGVHPPFPPLEDLPTSALLGRVDLVDVVEQGDLEDMRDTSDFPQSEGSSSPFVFYLRRPQLLTIPIAMRGRHKLWRLDAPAQYARGLKPAVFVRVS